MEEPDVVLARRQFTTPGAWHVVHDPSITVSLTTIRAGHLWMRGSCSRDRLRSAGICRRSCSTSREPSATSQAISDSSRLLEQVGSAQYLECVVGADL
jgi:hypothetical protein